MYSLQKVSAIIDGNKLIIFPDISLLHNIKGSK